MTSTVAINTLASKTLVSTPTKLRRGAMSQKKWRIQRGPKRESRTARWWKPAIPGPQPASTWWPAPGRAMGSWKRHSERPADRQIMIRGHGGQEEALSMIQDCTRSSCRAQPMSDTLSPGRTRLTSNWGMMSSEKQISTRASWHKKKYMGVHRARFSTVSSAMNALPSSMSRKASRKSMASRGCSPGQGYGSTQGAPRASGMDSGCRGPCPGRRGAWGRKRIGEARCGVLSLPLPVPQQPRQCLLECPPPMNLEWELMALPRPSRPWLALPIYFSELISTELHLQWFVLPRGLFTGHSLP